MYGNKKRKQNRIIEVNDVLIYNVHKIKVCFDGSYPVVCKLKDENGEIVGKFFVYKNEKLVVDGCQGSCTVKN